jgi:Rad3-related DNA helicase
MPTGTGKTHAVLDFIANHIINNGSEKIFFITSLKKNLPAEDLEKRFEDVKLAQRFNNLFLHVKSNSDSVLDYFNDDMTEDIRSCLPNKNSFVDLRKSISSIRRMEEKESEADADIVEKLKDDLRKKHEPAFRKDVI